MTQVQHRDDLPLCPTCERSDYLMRWDTSRTDWLCSRCQRMYWDSEMERQAEADGGWPAPDVPAPFHGIAVAVLLTLVAVLAVGVVWVVCVVAVSGP